MEILFLAAAVGTSALAAWIVDHRRSRARNRRGACGACGRPWADAASSETYLIHGQLVCADCAAKARRRIPWYFGTLILTTGGAAALTVASEGPLAMVLVPIGTTAAMTAGTVYLMKLANRITQHRIARGEFPDFEKVSGTIPVGSSTLPSPTAPE
jgi:hypothetical protein